MAEKVLLGLKLPSDPRWANIASQKIEDILIDHAWCEQKAASNAISLMVNFPEYSEMVDEMILICMEEMSHFKLVVDHLKKRGLALKKNEKDPYVNDLRNYIKKGSDRKGQLVEALLLGAMIEARSCERFKLLSEQLEDPELKVFYNDLMVSEAGHYATFLKFARDVGDKEKVDKQWADFLEFEASLMKKYGTSQTIHG